MKFGKIILCLTSDVKQLILFGLLIVGGILFFGADFANAKVYLPMGAGTYSAWTNNGGGTATYDRVYEYPVYDSADYNETSTTNARQSYNLEDVTDSGTIDSVKVVAVAQYIAGTPSLTLFLRLSASETIGTAQALTGSWVTYSEILAKPGGGSWSTSDITSLEAGFQMTGAGTAQVAQLYIDVVYKTEIQRVKYHVLQRVAVLSSTVDEPFSFYIADPIDEVRSAFIEIRGVSIPMASFTLGVTVNNNSATPGSYDAPYTINATGRPTSFKINHDVTNYFKNPLGGNVRTAGNYTKYIHLNTSSDIYLVGAKLIITYSWVKPPVVSGAYRASGTLVSSTFDTGSASGAAYNSILWKGSLNSGRVKFQLAASNCQNGATNSPTCTAGVWGSTGSDFYGEAGGNCSVANWYESSLPDEIIEVKACRNQFNNKRYFRYKIQLCSSNDCATPGNDTPQIDDVIINFSP